MILVTGATGLLGAHLILSLSQTENQLVAIYRDSNSIQKTKALFISHQKEADFNKISWKQADILDVYALENAFENITEVYHCAALISFNSKDEEKLRKINIEGTANIVNFCIDKKVKKLCYVSSIAALGSKKPHEKLINEESDWNPEISHSDYAITKYGAEMEVWRGQQEGLEVVILNPGIILAPIETSNIWKLGSNAIYTQIKKGLRYYTKGISGFVLIDDVISAMIQLMKSDISGERFCLVSENLSYKEVLQTIAEKMKRNKPSQKLKKWQIKIGLFIDWIMGFLFRTNRKLSSQMIQSWFTKDYYDASKIKDATGFEFLPILKNLK